MYTHGSVRILREWLRDTLPSVSAVRTSLWVVALPLLLRPSSACKDAMTWFASLRTSSNGSWAFLATSRASSVKRSEVVTRCFSRDGIRCVNDLVGKSGSTWRRSVIKSRTVGENLGRRDGHSRTANPEEALFVSLLIFASLTPLK